ncbi:DUF3617 domain-containing protein [Phenylobacterium sp.]|uniref:DUF3617 domain-containing protein n=1 Tax=Phenylobacterium sp. TaxID=1871053 RepID=UPI00374DD6CC
MRARIAGGIAAISAGLAAMGAEPSQPSAPTAASKAVTVAGVNAAILKVFPTARLYQITATGNVPGQVNGSQMCLGPEFMRKFAGAFVENPKAFVALGKGCTFTRDKKDDGSVRMEMSCDKAAGSYATNRMVIEGTMKDIHQHMDVVLDLGAGEPKTISTDTHMVDVGECPANMKSGQFRSADGTITDPMADLGLVGPKGKADAAPNK